MRMLLRSIHFKASAFFLLLGTVTLFTLTGCGGGGGDGDTGPPTTRPKSLDKLVIGFDGFCSFTFSRNGTTAGAISSGDVESGSFTYEFIGNSSNAKAYPNAINTLSNVLFPTLVNAGTYRYRAINENQAVLTLEGEGVSPGGIIFDGSSAFNNSFLELFALASPDPDADPPQSIGSPDGRAVNRIVEITITFEESNNEVDIQSMIVRALDSPFQATLDQIIIPVSTFRIESGGDVPSNYLGDGSPTEYGNNVVPGFANQILKATNGIPDPTKDFSLVFAPDQSGLFSGPDGTDPEEIGTCVLRVYDAVDDRMEEVVGINYTWRRILGTDTGELILSGVPNDPQYDFDSSLNGSMILTFTSGTSGNYAGEADGDTLDPAEVTGEFSLLSTGP